jgi:hypothetical protein
MSDEDRLLSNKNNIPIFMLDVRNNRFGQGFYLGGMDKNNGTQINNGGLGVSITSL